MRFEWLAAAAALVCAMPAQAARYYEFKITGSTALTLYDPFGIKQPYNFYRGSDFYATFDTQAVTSNGAFEASGVSGVQTFFTPTDGHIDTLNTTNSVFFDSMFDLVSIRVGSMLQPLSVMGSYGYNDCMNRYNYCTRVSGTLAGVSARTTDIAPSYLGEREVVTTAPAPEASTWMMMIAGVGLIGASLRPGRRVIRWRTLAG